VTVVAYCRQQGRSLARRIVRDAPCKEVILTGDDADVSAADCTHNQLDAAPFITMGLTIAKHPEYGTNVSISRIQVFDDKTLGILSVPPRQIGVYFQAFEAQGESLPIAVAIGNDPYTTLGSQPAEQPVFRLKAITHRRDPIYLAGLTGLPATDNHVMKALVGHAAITWGSASTAAEPPSRR
jgi:3-polyprenyl-4-hydroxybenzoate decarboxylase